MTSDMANSATDDPARTAADQARPAGSPLEVLAVFFKLGISCFGGPIAHIGYFRQEFVVRRRWIDEAAYADLVALCQFLPGPAIRLTANVRTRRSPPDADVVGEIVCWPS
jgi:chromate transporter